MARSIVQMTSHLGKILMILAQAIFACRESYQRGLPNPRRTMRLVACHSIPIAAADMDPRLQCRLMPSSSAHTTFDSNWVGSFHHILSTIVWYILCIESSLTSPINDTENVSLDVAHLAAASNSSLLTLVILACLMIAAWNLSE